MPCTFDASGTTGRIVIAAGHFFSTEQGVALAPAGGDAHLADYDCRLWRINPDNRSRKALTCPHASSCAESTGPIVSASIWSACSIKRAPIESCGSRSAAMMRSPAWLRWPKSDRNRVLFRVRRAQNRRDRVMRKRLGDRRHRFGAFGPNLSHIARSKSCAPPHDRRTRL